jgi:hypothetical protein
MRSKTVETAAEGIKYSVTVQLFESRAEVDSTLNDDGVLGVVNAAQEQNAKQGDKTRVRDAIRTYLAGKAGIDTAADGFDAGKLDRDAMRAIAKARANIEDAEILADENVAAAIKAHQDNAAGYVIGKPRGGSGGPTQKQQRSIGEAVTRHLQEHGTPPSQKQLAAIMAEIGIS